MIKKIRNRACMGCIHAENVTFHMKKNTSVCMLEERTDLSYKEDLRERERGKKYEENL